MARNQRRQGGPQPHVPGFRPGKEPPRLRQQQMKQQFGNATPSQRRMLEVFSGRTPEQGRALIRRWLMGALVAAIVLGVLAGLLMTWSVWVGAIVLILAVALLWVWFRLRKQRAEFEQLADMVGIGGSGPKVSRRLRRG